MTTAYPLDATTALPRVRRPSTSFEPRIAETFAEHQNSREDLRTDHFRRRVGSSASHDSD